MIIENNGIRLNVDQRGNTLFIRVLEQSEEATKILKFHKIINDEESKFSLKINKCPSYNHNTKRFFLRGYDQSSNDETFEANFASANEATNAIAALRRMINATIIPDDVREDDFHKQDKQIIPGSTTDFRTAIITKSQALKLSLTGKKLYPDERSWQPKKPLRSGNQHWNEHCLQAIDVMNKAVGGKGFKIKGAINEHKVTSEQATKALEILREAFDKAENEDVLVAFWRLSTFLRGPDGVQENFDDEPGHPN